MVLYLSILLLILCIILFTYNAKVNPTILYLLFFLISLGTYGINHHLYFFNDSAFNLSLIYIHFVPLYFIAGPMLYFYVRGTIKDRFKLEKKDLFHFLPAIIGLIAILPYIFEDWDYKLAISQEAINNPKSVITSHLNWLYPNYINVILRPVLLLGYSFLWLILIIKYSNLKSPNAPQLQKKFINKWLISITTLSILIAISYLFMTYTFLNTSDLEKEKFNQLPISAFTGFAYSIIPIVMFLFPGILYGIPKGPKSNKMQQEQNLEEVKNVDKIMENMLHDPLQITADKILKYLEEKKPYLNPNFCIEDISKELEIPKHHVGYCFNNILKTRFTTIRTELRITHAKRLLLSNQADIMTMEGIGNESGFASKSSFFSLFKEATGLSPYDYMKQNKNKSTLRKYPKNSL